MYFPRLNQSEIRMRFSLACKGNNHCILSGNTEEDPMRCPAMSWSGDKLWGNDVGKHPLLVGYLNLFRVGILPCYNTSIIFFPAFFFFVWRWRIENESEKYTNRQWRVSFSIPNTREVLADGCMLQQDEIFYVQYHRGKMMNIPSEIQENWSLLLNSARLLNSSCCSETRSSFIGSYYKTWFFHYVLDSLLLI